MMLIVVSLPLWLCVTASVLVSFVSISAFSIAVDRRSIRAASWALSIYLTATLASFGFGYLAIKVAG